MTPTDRRQGKERLLARRKDKTLVDWFTVWNESPGRPDGDVDWSYPPEGVGPVRMWLLGVLLPLVIGCFSVRDWITGEATWFGTRGNDLAVHGQAARGLAVAYLGLGLFCHFRWWWGVKGNHRVFEIGTGVSLLGFLGGLLWSLWRLMCEFG